MCTHFDCNHTTAIYACPIKDYNLASFCQLVSRWYEGLDIAIVLENTTTTGRSSRSAKTTVSNWRRLVLGCYDFVDHKNSMPCTVFLLQLAIMRMHYCIDSALRFFFSKCHFYVIFATDNLFMRLLQHFSSLSTYSYFFLFVVPKQTN